MHETVADVADPSAVQHGTLMLRQDPLLPSPLLQSSKRLNTTSEWRQKEKPESVICTACARDPRSHYMSVGRSLLGLRVS